MATARDLGNLHARISEVDPGLFKAEYVEGDREFGAVDAVSIPDSHIGTSRDGVKMWVEQMAANSGYRAVIWD
jgi:hypothetical protein